jgi:hypothetical protein
MAIFGYDHCEHSTVFSPMGSWPQTIRPPPGLTPAFNEPWDIAIAHQFALMEMHDNLGQAQSVPLADHNSPCWVETGYTKKHISSTRSECETVASSADEEEDDNDIIVIADEEEDKVEKSKSNQRRKVKTTAILRNIPSNFTREKLANLLDSTGFRGSYDFLHVPADISTGVALGYAFVNMCNAQAAQRLFTRMQGFKGWGIASSRVCEVNWVTGRQGFEACVERYRNSHLMHESVADGFKPAVFSRGTRVPFPRAKGQLRVPKSLGKCSASRGDHKA